MRNVLALVACILCASTVSAQDGEDWKRFPDPERFAEAIAKFEAADSLAPPHGAIVCTGSSSMRGWHRRIAADLAPLTVIPRGFGGSTYYDLLHFTDRVILAYRPRAVLIYEGDNDVAAGIAPKQIAATFKALATRLRGHLPELRIYVIGAKPSIARWEMWPQMAETNALVRVACDADPRARYIDVATVMLGDDGRPRAEIFVTDNLHLNDVGYDAWTAAVAPVLLAGEQAHETLETTDE